MDTFWSRYLCRGVSHLDTETFSLSDTVSEASRLSSFIARRGYALLCIDMDDFAEAACDCGCEDMDMDIFKQYQDVFLNAFSQSLEAKQEGGTYRNLQGLPVGFRKDDEREFFETREVLDASSMTRSVDPCYDVCIPYYSAFIKVLFCLMRKIAKRVLMALLIEINIDPSSVIELTDLDEDINQLHRDKRKREKEHKASLDQQQEVDQEVSSSLLRICSYPSLVEQDDVKTTTDTDDPSVVFGSHTDTSLLTIGLRSDNPGLELFDHEKQKWICADKLAYLSQLESKKENQVYCTVFVGEILQVLTRSYYRATIHRVRAPPSATRISCPFIIRGKFGRMIDLRPFVSSIKEGEEHPHIPDLNEMDIKTVHKMLDFKRAKCRRKYEDHTGSWVLSSELTK